MLSYNVADLLRSAPGTSERHDVEVDTLTVAEGVELADPISGEVRLTHTGRSILVQGTVETALAEQCSRCLRQAKSQGRNKVVAFPALVDDSLKSAVA